MFEYTVLETTWNWFRVRRDKVFFSVYTYTNIFALQIIEHLSNNLVFPWISDSNVFFVSDFEQYNKHMFFLLLLVCVCVCLSKRERECQCLRKSVYVTIRSTGSVKILHFIFYFCAKLINTLKINSTLYKRKKEWQKKRHTQLEKQDFLLSATFFPFCCCFLPHGPEGCLSNIKFTHVLI